MSFIPYGRQTIEQSDIDAVVDVLKNSDFLTTGPKVQELEDNVCQLLDVKYAIAVNSGTAALHCATYAINIQPGDEVIVPAISFVATANCVRYQGGTPIFCDLDPQTLNIDPTKIPDLITPKTKAIIAVDYAGQPCDYNALAKIAHDNNLHLITDGAHSFGLIQKNLITELEICLHSDGQPYRISRTRHTPGQPPSELTAFSFHPVKNMTTGEGGMVVTNDENLATRCRQFRCHGIDTDYSKRHLHYYDVIDLGFNYRITDLQCALGSAQLVRVKDWIKTRNEIADRYTHQFRTDTTLSPYITPLENKNGCAYHIYVILLNLDKLPNNLNRDKVFEQLKQANIGVNVHYRPIYQLKLYADNPLYSGSNYPNCPVADDAYNRMITIPIFPTLTIKDQTRVINTLRQILNQSE